MKQAVGVSPAEGDKGGVTLITKKTKHPQRPGSSVNKVTFGGNKSTRKCVHLANFTLKKDADILQDLQGYRQQHRKVRIPI